MDKKEYRLIKRVGAEVSPLFVVQMRRRWAWADVKAFHDADDPGFAEREAQELLETLNS